MKKVLLGMSGGVDSSTSAYLLKKKGYEVIGVTMILFDGQDLSNIEDAKEVCNKLNIEFRTVDLKKEFKEHVIDYFINSYKNGLTPNPCIECNKYLKFGALYRYAKDNGIDYIATGHYADNKDGFIRFSKSTNKDQSYFLYQINKDVIDHIIFPLSEFETKDEVRKLAKENNIPVASKKDSEEICFIKNNDYGSFLESNLDKLPSQGNFVDINGNVLGKHKGIIYYTIGQRKGLGISSNAPLYVISINKDNTITLGDEKHLFRDTLEATNINLFTDKIPSIVYAKIRFRGNLVESSVEDITKDSFKVIFKEKVRAITPGQSIVFYDESGHLLGGGIIK